MNYLKEISYVVLALLLAVGLIFVVLNFTTDLAVVRSFWIVSSVLHLFFILPQMWIQLRKSTDDLDLKRWKLGFFIAGIGQTLVSLGGVRFYYILKELRDPTELYIAAFIWLIVTIGITYAYWPRKH